MRRKGYKKEIVLVACNAKPCMTYIYTKRRGGRGEQNNLWLASYSVFRGSIPLIFFAVVVLELY